MSTAEVNELILTGEKDFATYHQRANTTKAYDSVTISKAADSMLAIWGGTTFVIACNQSGTISISARSRSKVNVQRIMEQRQEEVISIRRLLKLRSRFDEYSSTTDWDYWKQ